MRPLPGFALVFLSLFASASGACSARETALSEWQLESGRSLGELVGVADTAVVLIYDPSDCFACSSVLGRWLDAKRRSPDRVFLVFTRSPRNVERDQLRLYRIQPDGILSHRRSGGGITTPAAIVLWRRVVVAVGPPASFDGSNGVLEYLEQRPAQLRMQ
jgi:hypothetical protein